jgi:hypothetical protein
MEFLAKAPGCGIMAATSINPALTEKRAFEGFNY